MLPCASGDLDPSALRIGNRNSFEGITAVGSSCYRYSISIFSACIICRQLSVRYRVEGHGMLFGLFIKLHGKIKSRCNSGVV